MVCAAAGVRLLSVLGEDNAGFILKTRQFLVFPTTAKYTGRISTSDSVLWTLRLP
jgi:hypothetical protein